jgi:selenocysteine lyase/cysteine desulfurase
MQQQLGAYALGGSRAFMQMMDRIQETRALAAGMIGAEPEEVAFVPSVAIGMQYLAKMFSHLKSVAALADDFPTVRSAWELHGFELHDFHAREDGYIPFKTIEECTADVLTISQVQWHTGFQINPAAVGRLCHSRGQLFILDSTQSFGYQPIDVKKAQVGILFVSGYKWLMGGFGNAILYIRKELLDKYPRRIGWQFWEKDGQVLPSARRFELGHDRVFDILRTGHGLQFIRDIGQENISRRVYALNDYLRDRLRQDTSLRLYSDYHGPHRSAITIFEGDEQKLKQLQEQGIEISLRGKGLRASGPQRIFITMWRT